MDRTEIRFDEKGLVPAVAQEATTGEVLMVAYMNREALIKTLSTGRAHYWSRSRKKLWMKGETSGNYQEVEAVYYDCDNDTVLLKVVQTGVACHTGERTCFFRRLDKGKEERPVPPPLPPVPTEGPGIIKELYRVIRERKGASPESSYVASLYEKGPEKILEKVQEESGELIEAARGDDKEAIVGELCDLWFHTMVLLGEKDIAMSEVFGELKKRFGRSGIEEKESRKKR
jgi:phosphoribosyl-ATP pyrophosphohydrolase/phosphoribosyl-AMP cyclohydrolase